MIQNVRGTRDLLFNEQLKHKFIVDKFHQAALLAHYSEIELPLFEYSEVFHRVGESSDIVNKETYTFLDRGGDSITLRPEGTAQMSRALISNGLTQKLPCRLYNVGPMFRYERPQKGRYRQFTQAGIELFGVDSHLGDIEVIQLAHHFLHLLGIKDNISLEINSLGDVESKNNYREKLVNFFEKYKNDLSLDSQKRLAINPLRILDSKDINDQKIIQTAPLYKDSLNLLSQTFFDKSINLLTQLGIKFKINYHLVRGLDYYCHTAFEYIYDTSNRQNTVLAGGRYDGLVKSLGGPSIPGIGWAAGIDRLAMLLPQDVSPAPVIAIIPIDSDSEFEAFNIAEQIRNIDIPTVTMYSGSLNKRLKKINKINCKMAIFVGKQEILNNSIVIRDLKNSTETTILRQELNEYCKKNYKDK